MNSIEIVKKAKNENLLLTQTDFFTNGLSAEELNEIRGGNVPVECSEGYKSTYRHGHEEIKCNCGYKF